MDIEQGRLIETNVGKKKVLYQILDGLTREEIIHQKNTYGFARGTAIQIGIWDEDKKKFNICNWIPKINSSVFIKAIEKPEINANAIGYFPKSSYGVEINNIDQLVTHNTAILQSLGIGKSMLAIELAERIMRQGIKVVCIDLTNQYAIELSVFIDIDKDTQTMTAIQESGIKEKDSVSDNPEEGGSVNLYDAFYSDLETFLKEDNLDKLKIYNPSEFSATRQEQEPRNYKEGSEWVRGAGLWQVTPVEITRMITEICLQDIKNFII